MEIAEVFQSGNLPAIRFPKTFHLEASKVEIRRHAHKIILSPLPNQNLEDAFYALTGLSDDFICKGDNNLEPKYERIFNVYVHYFFFRNGGLRCLINFNGKFLIHKNGI